MQMVEFQQWLGFLLIMIIGMAGFWIFFFLLSILPYWIGGFLKDRMRERKEKKNNEEIAQA